MPEATCKTPHIDGSACYCKDVDCLYCKRNDCANRPVSRARGLTLADLYRSGLSKGVLQASFNYTNKT